MIGVCCPLNLYYGFYNFCTQCYVCHSLNYKSKQSNHNPSVSCYLCCLVVTRNTLSSNFNLLPVLYLRTQPFQFKLNCTHRFSQVFIIACRYLYSANSSTRKLNTLSVPTFCLCLATQPFQLNVSSSIANICAFSRVFIIVCGQFYVANSFYQLCIYIFHQLVLNNSVFKLVACGQHC